MTECDWSQARQKLRVFGLIPVSRELVGRADNDRVPLEGQWLGRLQPRPKRLFRKLVTCSVEYTRPDFGRRERHEMMWITRGRRGSEAIRSMWKKQTEEGRPLYSRFTWLDLSLSRS